MFQHTSRSAWWIFICYDFLRFLQMWRNSYPNSSTWPTYSSTTRALILGCVRTDNVWIVLFYPPGHLTLGHSSWYIGKWKGLFISFKIMYKKKSIRGTFFPPFRIFCERYQNFLMSPIILIGEKKEIPIGNLWVNFMIADAKLRTVNLGLQIFSKMTLLGKKSTEWFIICVRSSKMTETRKNSDLFLDSCFFNFSD